MTQRALAENHPGHGHVGETAPLTPMSLASLLARITHEWDTRKKIFDLPTARFWQPDPEIDLGFDFLGRRCGSPIGPAAGRVPSVGAGQATVRRYVVGPGGL